MTLHKTYPASFKALDEEAGTFEAIVSVFNNVDLIGDRVRPGAFAQSLVRWAASGDPVPIIWSHLWNNPDAHIGWVAAADVVETDVGLVVREGHLDLGKAFARQVYDLLKQRRVREFSFSYDVMPGGEKLAADGANDLIELDLIEAGPTLKGMNPATQLVGVKEVRRNSLADGQRMQDAHDLLVDLGVACSPVQEAKAEEPEGAKAEEPPPLVLAELIRAELDLIEL